MRRSWSRVLFTILITISVMFGFTSGAHAGARAGAGGPEIGELPSGHSDQAAAKGPALIVPHDVPMVLSTAHEAIPPVPPNYVTKDVGGWLELSYPPNAAERVASIIQDADAVKAELTEALGQPVLTKVTVRVAPTIADMARLAPADAPPPEYASGVAYHGLHFVLLSMLAPRGAEAVDLDEVFRHELAHVALEDAVAGRHVPVWFNEGLAIALSGEHVWTRRKTLADATLSGTLLPLADLDRSFPRDNFQVSIAYAEAADFVGYLNRKSDRLRFAAMIERIRGGEPFERAASQAYGSDLRRLEFEWHGDLERRFSIIPVLTGGGLIWVLVVGALVAAYVRRRRRSKAILARWAREEAIEDALIAKREAERAATLAVLQDVAATSSSSSAASTVATNAANAAQANRPSGSVKVEHHGRWHTLH